MSDQNNLNDKDIIEGKQINLFDEKIEPEDSILNKKFIIPPFSIIELGIGYIQTRKKNWLSLGIQSEKGRKKNLLYGKFAFKNMNIKVSSTSIFNPVICEVCYRWFNIKEGKILDPFAGGSVRGVVAGVLGYEYTGFDLRKEQIEEDEKQANNILKDKKNKVKYICDDSNNMNEYLKDDSYDMIFTCPPYFDLEEYSDDEKDLSHMDWESFKKTYLSIISKSCKKLKNNRFAIFVISDIRDKDGFYRGLPNYTDVCFLKNGLKLYNEIIISEERGTAAFRASRQFINRKLVRCHQIIKVYYKGDPKEIKNNFVKIIED